MTGTSNHLKLIIPFLLFVGVGIYGLYAVDYVVVSQTTKTTFEWCLLPTLIFALYYAYRCSFGYTKAIALWKNTLTFSLTTIMIVMVTFVSFQGLLMLINSTIGTQKAYKLSGEVITLHYPENKKIGAKYSIFIKREIEKDTIELNVPTNEYVEKQHFEKAMKLGSLQFIYSKK